jgi:hypothetical protein
MSWASRDPRMHRLVSKEIAVDVYMAVRRLISEWRDDPDRLAVAVTAYEGLGYHYAHEEISGGWVSRDQALEIVNAALRGRPKRILRARAMGLVMGLASLAADAERARLHDVQVGACVIECRQLSIDERVAKLRASDES